MLVLQLSEMRMWFEIKYDEENYSKANNLYIFITNNKLIAS